MYKKSQSRDESLIRIIVGQRSGSSRRGNKAGDARDQACHPYPEEGLAVYLAR